MVNDASSISRSGYTQNPRLAEAAFEGVRKNTDFLKAADKAFKDVGGNESGRPLKPEQSPARALLIRWV
ncbi:pathogenicity island 1 effector protein [Salmonella enterica subsp. enterica]|uniref:Pathogenicity island 1 effector protein n=1 Tax=Salmonella enterica I TaxID=59201 RepID=A0A3S4IHF6_SALET|nr:pathogenicity island 1 effector protein [Salmonella enterica subsp. enterica]